MINLGLSNSWKEKPQLVVDCEKKKHWLSGQCTETKSVSWTCYCTIVCKECGYYYNVDSSD